MAPKHTPGPWRIMDAEIEGADGSKIGELFARPEDDGTWGPGVADANSNLVVAAPDLLDLAERLVETATLCRDCNWDVLNHELVQLLTSLEREANEAIATAKGGRGRSLTP